ncbi:hypothetical protein, partial [Treponema sp. R6D11]
IPYIGLLNPARLSIKIAIEPPEIIEQMSPIMSPQIFATFSACLIKYIVVSAPRTLRDAMELNGTGDAIVTAVATASAITPIKTNINTNTISAQIGAIGSTEFANNENTLEIKSVKKKAFKTQ